MLRNLTKVIGGNPQKREIDRLRELVDLINLKEAEFEELDNKESDSE